MARSINSEEEGEREEVRLEDATLADESMAIPQTPRMRKYVADYTDGSELFPWADMPVFFVATLDSAVQSLLKMRIEAADGTVVRRIRKARVVVIPYQLNPRLLEAVENQLCVQDGTASIVKPHWILRTYFDGYAEEMDENRPSWENLKVSVAELGDDEARLDIMIALERDGALLVGFDDCNVCVVPRGHPFLERQPSRYEERDLRFLDAARVCEEFGVRPPQPPTPPAREVQPAPRKSTATSSKRAKVSSSRTAPSPGGRTPAIALPYRSAQAARTEFTSEDRHCLARYLAATCPEEKGRTYMRLYTILVGRKLPGPGDAASWEWTERHPAEGWRHHYRTYRGKPWKDGTVLDDLIKDYVNAGIGADLTTAHERRAARKRRQRTNDERRVGGGRAQESSPNVPLRSKRHLQIEEEPEESSDGDEEERVEPRTRKELEKGRRNGKRSPPASSSASDDAFVDEELSE